MACTENGTLWSRSTSATSRAAILLLGQHIDRGCYNGQTSWPKHIVPDYRRQPRCGTGLPSLGKPAACALRNYRPARVLQPQAMQRPRRYRPANPAASRSTLTGFVNDGGQALGAWAHADVGLNWHPCSQLAPMLLSPQWAHGVLVRSTMTQLLNCSTGWQRHLHVSLRRFS